MAGVAESRLHSTYLLNVKWGRKLLPVDPSHQRQLFRVLMTAASGGPGAAQPEQRPPPAAPPARYRPAPFLPALPYSTEPRDLWCYFPRLLIPGAARKWQDGPYPAPRPVALSVSTARTSLVG
jgi:hypothetical protein